MSLAPSPFCVDMCCQQATIEPIISALVYLDWLSNVTPTPGSHQKNNPELAYVIDFDVTPHQLRHTYITNLLYAGVDPKTVQYLAGHENSKTTM